LGFDRKVDFTQGTLEMYHPHTWVKFYVFTPNTQEKSWVHVAYEKTAVVYGGTVVDSCEGKSDNDPPVYLLCLSDLALLRFINRSDEEYWIFKDGVITPVCKEWLVYLGLIPGVLQPGTVIEPSQPLDEIREKLLALYYEG
jgi:hypothetical protein